MRRAISPIVATILILVITVALAGGLLVFLMNLQGQLTQQTQQQEFYTLDVKEVSAKAYVNTSLSNKTAEIRFYATAVGNEIPGDEQVLIKVVKVGDSNCVNDSIVLKISDIFGGSVSVNEFTPGKFKVVMPCDLTVNRDTLEVTITLARGTIPETFRVEVVPMS